ncbi:DUF732 domain-containing protein [Mycobacterium sp. M1]|uniref:DUF732 domain-containing protein n=1 Tax=Mycolicibacter acidiphilus TaxID=2835306 RepID=A0ABS5RP76_9MYCO|nr:DUF732 domain-containing protein [Mycolicibacter acidiphilus]MBS9536009.1 DUF732 domain-containing protein [Mycolicibacter acidiphilus]
MKRVLLSAGMGVLVLVGSATPACADDAGPDGGFLRSLTGAGLSHRGSDQTAITAGRAVCQLMDAGLSPMDTVTAVQTTNPGFTIERAAQFAAISTASYCPEHM